MSFTLTDGRETFVALDGQFCFMDAPGRILCNSGLFTTKLSVMPNQHILFAYVQEEYDDTSKRLEAYAWVSSFFKRNEDLCFRDGARYTIVTPSLVGFGPTEVFDQWGGKILQLNWRMGLEQGFQCDMCFWRGSPADHRLSLIATLAWIRTINFMMGNTSWYRRL